MKITAIFSAVLLASSANAAELIVATGKAQFARCGWKENGCWDQPPLPSQWNQNTYARGLGLRIGSFEVMYQQMGTVGVSGTYVEDWNYDPVNARVIETRLVDGKLPTFVGTVTQKTDLVSILYAPTFGNRFSLTPKGGIAIYDQRAHYLVVGTEPQWGKDDRSQHQTGVTPAIGLSAAVRVGKIKLSLDGYWFKRVRATADMPLGGTTSSKAPPGLRITSISAHIPLGE